MFKAFHAADFHFSNKLDKLTETITTSSFLIEAARREKPDVAILAGDLMDEHDGPIRFDSATVRSAIWFIEQLGSICPVVIVRGTRSHDRDTPELFSHVRTKYPVYVGSVFEMVAITTENEFIPVEEASERNDIKAVFTLLPSPDKANMIATLGGDTGSSTTLKAKEALNDVLGMFGQVNSMFEGTPRIAVGHGMITGAEYSSGQTATGEDLEYCLSDFSLLNVDLVAFGHVHKHQSFAGNVFYSGSIGRLDLGEKEEKGFLVHDMEGSFLTSSKFVNTPTRTFVLYDVQWREEDGYDNLVEQFEKCLQEADGNHVRFRYTIAEESRHMVRRDELYSRLIEAGAKSAKVELTVIPKVRQRAAGISQIEILLDKLLKWGETASVKIPDRSQTITMTIESRDVDELIDDAIRHVESMCSAGAQVQLSDLEDDLPYTDQPATIMNVVAASKENSTTDGYLEFQESLFA